MAYAFYHAVPEIIYVGKRRCHEFQCLKRDCKYASRHFLDTKDRASTGNMLKHAKVCWGEDVCKMVDQCRDLEQARSKITEPIASSGAILAGFRPEGNVVVKYSHRMPMKTEIK